MDISNFSDCWLLSLPFFFLSLTQSLAQSLTHLLIHRSLSLSFLSFLSTQTLLSSIFIHSCTFFLLSPLPFFTSYLHNNRSLVHSSSLYVFHLHNRGQEVEVRELRSLVYSCMSSLLDLYK